MSCILLLSACRGTIPLLKAPLGEDGEALLYVDPFPQEADRLRFGIEGISARGSDGREFPFDLRFTEFRGETITRQRLLGAARLPAGDYLGLSVKVKDAFIKRENGEAALLVGEAPARLDFPFQVARKKGYVFSLTFKPAESVQDGFSFNPVFSLLIPSRPLASLTGYVTNAASGNITVFDKRAGRVAGVIATERGPAGIALDRRGRKVYAAIPASDAIEVIDVAAGEATDRINLTLGDNPRELAVTPDGQTLLAVNAGSNTVSVIDLVTLSETGRIAVGNGPASILPDPRGRRAYCFNSLSATISVIDIPNRALVRTLSVDPGPLRGHFNRRGDRFYVIHEWSSYVSSVDAATLSVARRMPVGMGMRSIKVDPLTDLVYLGKENDIAVGVYEPFSFVPVDYIKTGAGVTQMAIDGDENNLVLVAPALRKLVIVNLISKKTVAELDVGEAPYGAALIGER